MNTRPKKIRYDFPNDKSIIFEYAPPLLHYSWYIYYTTLDSSEVISYLPEGVEPSLDIAKTMLVVAMMSKREG